MKKVYPVLAATVLCLWIPPAVAYIDPGSGSAIMSAVIGFFIAVGLAIKTYWYKIKSFFTNKTDSERKADQETR